MRTKAEDRIIKRIELQSKQSQLLHELEQVGGELKVLDAEEAAGDDTPEAEEAEEPPASDR